MTSPIIRLVLLERLQVSHPTPCGPSDSSRSNMVTSTARPLQCVHHGRDEDQFFNAVTFESQSLTENGAKTRPYGVCGVVLPPLRGYDRYLSSTWLGFMAIRKESFNRLSKPQWVQLSLAGGSASLRQASDLGAVSQLTFFFGSVSLFNGLASSFIVVWSTDPVTLFFLDIMSSLSHLVRQRIHIQRSVSREPFG